jgi:(4S)-4-hydroxy-5-phosphonooxypentane-2,3-dione isomerase
MISVVVSIRAIPERREEYLAAIGANAAAAVRDEPGCLGFDVCEDTGEPNHFLLYEQYVDRAAVDAHRATPHYAAWTDAAASCVVPDSKVVYVTEQLLREPGDA